MTAALIIAGFVIVILAFSLKIFREYERGVVFFLGRFQSVQGPGLRLIVPGIQQFQRIDLRIRVHDVPEQDVITRDNVSVKVNAVVYFRVIDAQKSVLQVEDFMAATSQLERVRHRQNQKGDSQGLQKVIQAMSWVKGGQPWMTRPYSEDLRERVVRVVESGTSRNAAAKQFDVSISFVVKLMQRWKQRGTIKADKYGGWKKSKLAPHGDRIRALVMENCDITIDELCVLLAAEGIEAKRSTLGDFLLAQGLSRKKRQPTPPSRSALTSRRREPLGATSNLG